MTQRSALSLSLPSLALVVAAGLTGCAGDADRPPPTRDEVVHACGEWNLAACRKLGECLGWPAAEVQQCVNDENARCAVELEGPSCLEDQRDAYERCSADVPDDACDAVCGDGGFCYLPCLYACPAPG